MPSRWLIVNADDFGFTRGVNAGIIEAHRNGILTATTLMANGPAFDDAVRLARANPSLDVGCHLVLVGGCSLLDSNRAFPATIRHLLLALATRRLDVYAELRAQVDWIVQAGLQLSHLDTHKHTHLLPPVRDAVARLARETGIRWVRRPFDFPISGPARAPWTARLAGRAFAVARGRFHRAFERHGCLMTDHFAGFLMTGRFHTADLAGLIALLPEGLTEFMCHPGRCIEELRKAPTRLKESRERELEALLAPQTRAALTSAGVRLTNYREESLQRS